MAEVRLKNFVFRGGRKVTQSQNKHLPRSCKYAPIAGLNPEQNNGKTKGKGLGTTTRQGIPSGKGRGVQPSCFREEVKVVSRKIKERYLED